MTEPIITVPDFASAEEFTDTTFTNIVCADQKIFYKTFERCVFTHGDFTASHFTGTVFVDCVFSRCNLSLIKVEDVRLQGVRFENCKLAGIDFSVCNPAFMNELIFSQCLVQHVNFTRMKIPGTKFVECTFQETDFVDMDLSKASFYKSTFTRSRFQNSNLSKADFRGAGNYDLNPLFNKIKGAKFSMPDALSLLKALDVSIE